MESFEFSQKRFGLEIPNVDVRIFSFFSRGDQLFIAWNLNDWNSLFVLFVVLLNIQFWKVNDN